MFEVRCIVGDKKLSDTLRALRGHTIEPPVVIPVEEDIADDSAKVDGLLKAAATKPQPKFKKRRKPIQMGGKHLKGRGATVIVRDLITSTGATQISSKEMKRATMAQGYSPGAYSHAIKLLVADKTIRALNSFGDYEVVKPAVKTTSTTATAQEMIQNG